MAELATLEDRWLYYLENAAHMTKEEVKALGVAGIEEAEEKLHVISQDRELQMLYEQRMKAERDAEVWQKDWIAEWLEQGEKKGRREGLDEGRRDMAAESVLEILEARGLPISPSVRERVLSCQDLATLKRYLTRAAVAASAEEAIAK